jgi:hypothetical protein
MRLVRLNLAPLVRVDLDPLLLDEVVVAASDGGHASLTALEHGEKTRKGRQVNGRAQHVRAQKMPALTFSSRYEYTTPTAPKPSWM